MTTVCRATLLAFLGLLASAHAQIPIGLCRKTSQCSCVYDDGTIVSLAPLDREDGKPNFSNVTDKNNDLFSWNPCTPFTYDDGSNGTSGCHNVSVCMIRHGLPKDLVFDLGKPDSAQFMVDANGTLKLTYTADEGEFKRVAEITLQCMETSKFDFFVAEGEQDINNDTIIYKLLLASRYSCHYAPHINPSEKVSTSLGGGVIFIIVLSSLIGTYLILGVLYQLIVKKESGVRLCPNYEFWCSIPALCKSSPKPVSPQEDSKKPLSEDAQPTYETL